MLNSAIETYVDQIFPHRNENGGPAYRQYQRETIIKILNAFITKNKKFVTLDGPVGSGKSAICYTVGMAIKNAVYLTSQKQLQDQIIKECWPGIKMVKGKSSYLCNKCGFDKKISCTYSGDEFKTCNNSIANHKYYNELELLASIYKTLKMFKYSQALLRMRTGFELNDSIESIFDAIYNKMIDCNPDLKETRANLIGRAIGCKKDNLECPVKSTRFISTLFPVRLLNPDVFYAINQGNNKTFMNNNLMIIDECHTLEKVVQRIFETQLHVGMLKELFGINLVELFDCNTPKEFVDKFNNLLKKYINPIFAAISILHKMGDAIAVKDFESYNNMKSENPFSQILKTSSREILKCETEFCLLTIANNAFKQIPIEDDLDTPPFLHEFRKKILEAFLINEEHDKDQRVDLYEEIIPACIKYLHKIKSEDDIRYVAAHISSLKEPLELFIKNFKVLAAISNGEHESFVIDKEERSNPIQVCRGTPLEKIASKYYENNHSHYGADTGKVIGITPIAIGNILKYFFYSTAEKVLLSTGTWVDYDGMLRVYGIDGDQCEHINMKSTFNHNRRPVYVLSNSRFTNFSKKNNDKEYIYKTEEGTIKFCNELSDIIEITRSYIERRHNECANIVIHCHTFDMAQRIAKYCPIVDSSFKIHLPLEAMPIENIKTNYKTRPLPQGELLQHLTDNPSRGIILVSPSISEGVDFKYQTARAQIILKRPIPYLGSPYVNAYYKGNENVGIKQDLNYIDRVSFTEIAQQYGRVMRAPDDWGYTIIMDQALVESLTQLLHMRSKNRLEKLNINYFLSGIMGGRNRFGVPTFKWLDI